MTSWTWADGPPLSYRAFVPPQPSPHLPLVLVHGAGRRAASMFRAFLPQAISLGVPLIAPLFPADRFTGYQSLGGADGPLAALTAFLATLDDAAAQLQLPTDRIDVLGFSGGAQFAHRLAMVEPGRVRSAVVASAGWYTYLDDARPFPCGVAPSARSGGRAVDAGEFLRIRIGVLVGDRDVERDARLRTGRGIDRRQGRDRLSRALHWTDHLEKVGSARGLPSRISFDLLSDTGHSFVEAAQRGGLVARSFDFLHSTGIRSAPI